MHSFKEEVPKVSWPAGWTCGVAFAEWRGWRDYYCHIKQMHTCACEHPGRHVSDV